MFRRQRIKSCGGFVFAEFAIALPLMILLMYGLAHVSKFIFEQSAKQVADYVLEEEARYLLERITHQARAAKAVEARNGSNSVKFIYNTACDFGTSMTIDNVSETQWYLAHRKADSQAINLYAKRNNDGTYLNPIIGDNSFGKTTLVNLKFSELNKNVLHITLELKHLDTDRTLKISTAVYMPACESKSGLPHE